jgi:hypothetical protein
LCDILTDLLGSAMGGHISVGSCNPDGLICMKKTVAGFPSFFLNTNVCLVTGSVILPSRQQV